MSDARRAPASRRRWSAVLAAAIVVALLAPFGVVSAHGDQGHGDPRHDQGKAVFFAADGLRQDAVAAYVDKGLLPTMGSFLKKGAYASGSGLLTQAPPNTGAGWYTLATGAWPGITGSTNNTFRITGTAVRQPDRGVRPGRAPGRDHRPVRRAGRSQGRPGRVGRRSQRDDQRADDRLPDIPLRARRRNQLHRQGGRRPVRRSELRRELRPPVRPSCRFRRPGALPGAAPTPAAGWTNVPASYSPAHGDASARPRLRRRQVRPERLHLRQHERRRRRTTTASCSRPPRTARRASAPWRKGQWADVKVKITRRGPRRQDGRDARQGRGR